MDLGAVEIPKENTSIPFMWVWVLLNIRPSIYSSFKEYCGAWWYGV
jgi:hypothetical protein